MKLSILTVVFFLFCSTSFSQKPMSKEIIETKLDSLMLESNLLYNLVIKSNHVKEYIESNHKLNPSEIIIVNYIVNDTLHSTALKKKEVIERFVHHADPFISLIPDSSLIETENYHMDAMKILYKDQKKNGATLDEGYFYETYYVGKADALRLYQLSSTSKEDAVPFGGDYLYILKENNEVVQIKFQDFDPQFIKPNTSRLILIYKNNLKYINAVDIYKFRRFNTDDNFTSFSAFSRYNKTMFRYNKPTNEILIKNAFED